MYIINSIRFGETAVLGVATNLKMLTFMVSEIYDDIFEVSSHSDEKLTYKELCLIFKHRKEYNRKSTEICDYAEDPTTIKVTYINDLNELFPIYSVN